MTERPKPENRQGLVEGVLTEIQRWQIVRALDFDGRLSTSTRKGLLDALQLFRPTDLVPAHFDWEKLNEEAERRHCTEAEAIFDLARGRDAA